MKTAIAAVSALLTVLAIAQARAATGTDPLTHLPLPDAASTVRINGTPMALPDVPVCKSKSTMNFYSTSGGKMDAAIAWYSANLKGFKHTHGTGSGRAQDTFYNSTGTLIVSITGAPAAAGQNADVYSIIYGAIQPGASEKAIIGMNVQKVDCT